MSETYIYGKNAIIEALLSKKDIEKIYIQFGTQGEPINRIYGLAKKNDVKCLSLDKRKFAMFEEKAGIMPFKSQGVIAITASIKTFNIVELIEMSFQSGKEPVLIALDEITDPQNLGAIARTAECSGASGMIITERNSPPITPVVIKASAGALEHIPVAKVNNLSTALEKCKDAGFWIVGTDSDAETFYDSPIYNSPIVLIIGSEGKGIRQGIRNNCDYLVKIPLKGKISSLNASVSAGIVLFEINRQRLKIIGT